MLVYVVRSLLVAYSQKQKGWLYPKPDKLKPYAEGYLGFVLRFWLTLVPKKQLKFRDLSGFRVQPRRAFRVLRTEGRG